MKYILITLLTAITFSLNAQVYQTTTSYGVQNKREKVDSAFNLPFLSPATMLTNIARPGALVMSTADSTVRLSVNGTTYGTKLFDYRDTISVLATKSDVAGGTPTLQQVTTAGNTTSNSVTVASLLATGIRASSALSSDGFIQNNSASGYLSWSRGGSRFTKISLLNPVNTVSTSYNLYVPDTNGTIALKYQIDSEAAYAVKYTDTAAMLTNYTRSSRAISTTSPLLGGGDLSADRTLSLAGLSGLGTSNQILGMNNAANAYEYKTVTAGTGTTVTHAANSITVASTDVWYKAASVNLKNTGATTITTTESGRGRFIPSRVEVHLTAVSGFSGAATVGVGVPASYISVAGAQSLTSLTALNQVVSLTLAPSLISVAASTVIAINVAVAATATTMTADIYIYGHYETL